MMYRGDRPMKKMPPGRKRGFVRLAIVVAVSWFGFWGFRAFVAYQDYLSASESSDYIGQLEWKRRAWDEFMGNIVGAFFFPIVAGILFLVLRWIIRGFRDPGTKTDV